MYRYTKEINHDRFVRFWCIQQENACAQAHTHTHTLTQLSCNAADDHNAPLLLLKEVWQNSLCEPNGSHCVQFQESTVHLQLGLCG